jgi:hypothetical protein
VRGDVRISSKPIDGGGSILAYNYYPQNGDMVLDADDIGFYSSASSNYLRLFNVIAHEHGHGIGIAHVCPSNGTKLMEPFINVGFSGPQFDEILTAQLLYGDRFEHNDTAGTATDLGTLANGPHITTLLSVDGDDDQDWYRFTTTGPKQVGVIVSPTGTPYLEGNQNNDGSCQPGTTFDPSVLRDLGFAILDGNGTTVLASVDAQPAGSAEVAPSLLLPAGNYYVRVFGGPIDQVQLYRLDVTIGDPPPFTIQIVGGAPATVPTDAPPAIDVEVIPDPRNADPATGVLLASIDGGPYAQSALSHLGGNDYRGLLPPGECFQSIRWYVRFGPQGGGAPVSEPLGAPASAFTTDVLNLPLTIVFADDFETNQGWSVVNDAALTDGAWDRGVPIGGGDRGDPPTDADGSGQCYLTDNVDGNSDVDGGATSLLTPLLDLSGYPDARITWSYWYTNNFGGTGGQDVWLTEISNNGGQSWVTVQNTTASTSGWTERSLMVSDFVALTNQVRMRFTASDPPPGAVVEAGIDAFRVETCPPSATEVLPGTCGGPFTQSTIGTNAPPLAGTTISIDCTAAADVSGPVIQGFVLGLAQVTAPLPSCGCIVHPSLDVIDIGVGVWAAPALATWSIPVALPAGAAGLSFWAQGLVAGTAASTCSEAGLLTNTTDGLRITVQ